MPSILTGWCTFVSCNRVLSIIYFDVYIYSNFPIRNLASFKNYFLLLQKQYVCIVTKLENTEEWNDLKYSFHVEITINTFSSSLTCYFLSNANFLCYCFVYCSFSQQASHLYFCIFLLHIISRLYLESLN